MTFLCSWGHKPNFTYKKKSIYLNFVAWSIIEITSIRSRSSTYKRNKSILCVQRKHSIFTQWSCISWKHLKTCFTKLPFRWLWRTTAGISHLCAETLSTVSVYNYAELNGTSYEISTNYSIFCDPLANLHFLCSINQEINF